MKLLWQNAAVIWTWHWQRRTRVLLYHRIAADRQDPLAVTPKDFAQQMTWLADHRWQVVSARALEQALCSGRSLRHSVVLTFDDAYLDFIEYALPILRSFGYPATQFVPTGLVGQCSRWSQTSVQPLMQRNQLALAVQYDIELGSHSTTHPSLPVLDENALRRELDTSRDYICALTGQASVAFAYPFGRAANREVRLVKQSGYRSAYLAGGLWGNGPNSDRFRLSRDVIHGGTSLSMFARQLNGAEDLRRVRASLWHQVRRP